MIRLFDKSERSLLAAARASIVRLTLFIVLAIGMLPAQDRTVVKGTVRDASDAVIPGGKVDLTEASTGFAHQTRTAVDGSFSFQEVPKGSYKLSVYVGGFQTSAQLVTVKTALPIELEIRLAITSGQTRVDVEAQSDTLIQNDPAPSHTVDRSTIDTLPTLSPGSGLNDAITFTSPNVAADSNGFFHPLGDHAQVSYVIDGQPISDQRNKVFSTAIPENAIQSMDIISGSPSAEYGDKTSLIINATTRSGLGQNATGSFLAHAGSFGSYGEDATFALGGSRWGNFVAVNSERTGRFLDTPEFWPMHDKGTAATVFHRVDYKPTGSDTFHLDLLGARNWTQIPNTYDQPQQDQRQKVVSFNVGPGYQKTIGAQTLFTASLFVRRDQVDYYPTRNELNDTPATLAQARSLLNYGVRTDLSHAVGRHNFHIGITASQTKLDEAFSLGITDATYNSPCRNASGSTIASPSLISTFQCGGLGLQVNSDFVPGLARYDLTRGGSIYQFRGKATISQVAWFAQDSITLGNLTLNIGLRDDYYNGLTRGGGPQPRGAFSYLFKPTKTVIRGGYSHTLETPVNENLVASSSTGSGGLASNLYGSSAQQRAITLGSRNQYDAGIQQSFGKWLLLDVSYFRKYTRNAFDFDALLSTPITFPIGWAQSKLDGVGARISTPEIHGLTTYATMGHANARFFGPETGGIIFNLNLSIGAYRQDHDQVYQQNFNMHYQPRKNGWWGDFTWRYDSGLVVGAVNGLSDALALTADQQSAIGLFCGSDQASLNHRISSCSSPNYGAQRITILPPGTENDDHNPPRAKLRNVFHMSAGNGNLFNKERIRTELRFTVINLSNEAAVYNFLSPFSGTHWIQPRTYQVQMGWKF